MIVAVVPAAGNSSRMGRPKLSLPLGDQTVLEHVVAALRAGCADLVVVVIGPHLPELVPLAEAAGAVVCQLDEPTPDMRATVERGLAWIDDQLPMPCAWLLAPADHPSLDPRTVYELIAEFVSDASHSIFIPTHSGRRGHPTLVAWKHVKGVRAMPPDRGLNAYFREHASEVREVAVARASVLCDLDTPEDYERLCELWRSRE